MLLRHGRKHEAHWLSATRDPSTPSVWQLLAPLLSLQLPARVRPGGSIECLNREAPTSDSTSHSLSHLSLFLIILAGIFKNLKKIYIFLETWQSQQSHSPFWSLNTERLCLAFALFSEHIRVLLCTESQKTVMMIVWGLHTRAAICMNCHPDFCGATHSPCGRSLFWTKLLNAQLHERIAGRITAAS